MLGQQFPSFYSQLLPNEILEIQLAEKAATCEQCVRAQNPRRSKFYAPNLKCCTFHPFLPNYTVGAILSGQDMAPNSNALEVVREKIQARQFSLPIGLVAPLRLQIEYNQFREVGFGLNEEWLCPYFDRGELQCGIWRLRGSVCTGFYCVSSYGESGMRFWKSLEDYLSYLEMALMEEALAMMDFAPRQVSQLLVFLNRQDPVPAQLGGWTLSAKESQNLWNGYHLEQEEFFKKCFQIVKGMNRKDLIQLIGDLGCRLEREVVRRGHKLLTGSKNGEGIQRRNSKFDDWR